jgi:hypothetical protein
VVAVVMRLQVQVMPLRLPMPVPAVLRRVEQPVEQLPERQQPAVVVAVADVAAAVVADAGAELQRLPMRLAHRSRLWLRRFKLERLWAISGHPRARVTHFDMHTRRPSPMAATESSS